MWNEITTKPPLDTPILVYVPAMNTENKEEDIMAVCEIEELCGTLHVNVINGITGYEWEIEFHYTDITHWIVVDKPIVNGDAFNTITQLNKKHQAWLEHLYDEKQREEQETRLRQIAEQQKMIHDELERQYNVQYNKLSTEDKIKYDALIENVIKYSPKALPLFAPVTSNPQPL